MKSIKLQILSKSRASPASSLGLIGEGCGGWFGLASYSLLRQLLPSPLLLAEASDPSRAGGYGDMGWWISGRKCGFWLGLLWSGIGALWAWVDVQCWSFGEFPTGDTHQSPPCHRWCVSTAQPLLFFPHLLGILQSTPPFLGYVVPLDSSLGQDFKRL